MIFYFIGRNIPNLRVRVGNNHNKLEFQEGHETNPICSSPITESYANEITTKCRTPLDGRYLTLESTSIELTSLSVCNIKFNTA